MSKESVARLLIFIIAPAVIFNYVLGTPLALNTIVLPFLFFILCCLFALLFLKIGSYFWSDPTKNILAFTAGTGNTGYFGLPVAIALFGNGAAGLVVLSTLGFLLYENSLGFFITARGHHTAKDSLLRVLKLPTIYAFIFALLLNIAGVKLNQSFIEFASLFRGAYTILGVMLIGLGLASIGEYKLDLKFTALTFLAKFIVWPLVIFAIIFIDKTNLNFFTPEIYKVMILMATVPLAANTVAFATELKAHPEKASFAVLLSTLVALFYIPLVSMFFLS